MSIFKYLAKEEYALDLLEKGLVRFSTLASFRAYEDGLVRGDPDDGKLHYKPTGGLTITKQNGEVLHLDQRFRASVRASDIYVYCMSNQLSGELAAKFESPYCVEFERPIGLIGRIRQCVRMRSALDHNNLHSRTVDYRPVGTEPGIDWALPERVAFIKPEAFAWQDEYRIVIGNKGAFDVENVELALVGEGATTERVDEGSGSLILKVGNLSRIAKLHKL